MSLVSKMLTSVASVMSTRVRYITAVKPKRATGLVAEVYEQAARDMLLAGPFTLHSPCPQLLAGSWAVIRETLLTGDVARVNKEAVATGVSLANECPFCVDVHSSSRVQAATELTGSEPYLDWASHSLEVESDVLKQPPFDRADPKAVAENIGVAVAFHYINRVVNVFLDDTPMPGPKFMSGMMNRVARPMMREVVQKQPEPGLSLALVPEIEGDVEVSDVELSWASGSPTIETAYRRYAALLERDVEATLPDASKACVRRYIAAWDGTPPPLGRSWLTEATATLPEADQPAANLALTTALTSYQVDDTLVMPFRERHPSDRALVALTAWASLTAALRVGSWL